MQLFRFCIEVTELGRFGSVCHGIL